MKRPVHAQPLELKDDMTVEQAAHAILLNCLNQIEANRAQVAGGQSPESVHQMRVGLRRLRSALDLFNDVIRPGSRLRREIEWLGNELGPARDWDAPRVVDTTELIFDGYLRAGAHQADVRASRSPIFCSASSMFSSEFA